MVAERLQQKSGLIIQWLKEYDNNWEEVFWISLSRSFGMKVNAELFEQIAKTIPVNLLAKHKNQIHQLEALLLGQAGLLNEDLEDDYAILLKKEYNFLSKKYGLKAFNKQPDFFTYASFQFSHLKISTTGNAGASIESFVFENKICRKA